MSSPLEVLQSPPDPDQPVFEPPDGGYGWVVCFACFWLNLFQAGIAFSHGVILNSLVNEFEEKHARVALIGSLLNGFLLGVGPLASLLVDRSVFQENTSLTLHRTNYHHIYNINAVRTVVNVMLMAYPLVMSNPYPPPRTATYPPFIT